MSAAERVLWNPLWFWMAAGVVTVPGIYVLFREVVSRRITAVEFGVGLAVIFSIWAAIAAAWGNPAGFVLFVYLGMASVYMWVMCDRIAALSDRPILERELKRAQGEARRHPDNAAARAYLGELLLRLGRAQEAVTEFSEAIRLSPQPHYQSRLREANELVRMEQTGRMRCRVCGAENAVSAPVCTQCGRTLAGPRFVAETVGLTYVGRPRWSASLLAVPVVSASVALGDVNPFLPLAMVGALSLWLVWLLTRLVRAA